MDAHIHSGSADIDLSRLGDDHPGWDIVRAGGQWLATRDRVLSEVEMAYGLLHVLIADTPRQLRAALAGQRRLAVLHTIEPTAPGRRRGDGRVLGGSHRGLTEPHGRAGARRVRRCPGFEEGPDMVVRPGGTRRSEAGGPYDPIPARWCGRVAGCLPRTTGTRTAAPVSTGCVPDLLIRPRCRRGTIPNPHGAMRMHTPDFSSRPDRSSNGHSAPVARLAALAMHLGTRGLDVDVTREGLLARDPNRPATAHPITCRPRREDAGRLWFFAGTEDMPVAEADQIYEAAIAIRALVTTDGGGHR